MVRSDASLENAPNPAEADCEPEEAAELSSSVEAREGAEEFLLTKDEIMRRFRELEAEKENNSHYIIDSSILNAKQALLDREEDPEELYDFLDEDASPLLYL